MKIPTVVLVGIGGYGNLYVNELLKLSAEGKCSFVAAVEPFPQSAPGYERLCDAGVKIYKTLGECYADFSPDLCCISAPIQFHTRYTLYALTHGSSVLCEKPLSADWRDAELISTEAEKRGLFVMSGYQWSHSHAILSLKNDILAGKFGAPVSMKTIILWPRRQAYFKRGSGWAGTKYACDGTPVFDSVANNAAAHYLHNMLYLLGDNLCSAAIPDSVDAELFRANPIENFDTSLIRANFGGVSALFIASHAIAKNVNPRFEYAFENGTVYYDQDGYGSVIRAEMKNGETIEYGDPFEHDANKVDIAVNNASVSKSERFLPCTADTASVHTRCICALENCGIVSFPDSMINVLDKERDPLRTAAGLDELLEKCYAGGKLISEEAPDSDIGKITKTEYNIKVEK